MFGHQTIDKIRQVHALLVDVDQVEEARVLFVGLLSYIDYIVDDHNQEIKGLHVLKPVVLEKQR